MVEVVTIYFNVGLCLYVENQSLKCDIFEDLEIQIELPTHGRIVK